jgi:hypothetical protein
MNILNDCFYQKYIADGQLILHEDNIYDIFEF